jgi:hypothetical protein
VNGRNFVSVVMKALVSNMEDSAIMYRSTDVPLKRARMAEDLILDIRLKEWHPIWPRISLSPEYHWSPEYH